MTANIHIELNNQIILCKSEVPDYVLNCIKDYHTLNNPKYLEAQKRGYFTKGIDPKTICYCEDTNSLYLPRGYMGNLLSFLCRNGFGYRITDYRRTLPEVKFSFQGNLREYQQRTVMESLQKNFGVLIVPCGSDKTKEANDPDGMLYVRKNREFGDLGGVRLYFDKAARRFRCLGQEVMFWL